MGAVTLGDPKSMSETTIAAPTWSRGLAALLLSSLIAGGGYWFLRTGGMPILPPRTAWAHVDEIAILMFGLTWLAVLGVRSIRWVWLLAPQAEVSTSRVMLIALTGFAAVVVLPLRLGEFARPLLVRKYERVSSLTAVGTVAAERIIDGVCFSAIMLIAMRLRPIEGDSRTVFDAEVSIATVSAAVQSMAVLFAVALLLVGACYWKRSIATTIVEKTISRVSPHAARACVSVMDRLFAGFSFLPHRGYLAKFMAATVVYWALNGAGIWIVAHGCGVPIDLGQAFVCLGILALGVLIPNAPGFFGIFQSSVYLGLALYVSGVALEERGPAVVFLLYVVHVGGTLIIGGVAWVWLQFITPK
jgi:hypothetical protein